MLRFAKPLLSDLLDLNSGQNPMMGRQPPPQPSLFYTSFNLEKRVRSTHPLRKVAKAIDFDFVYEEVEDFYGTNGNVSVPPPVILKLMFLLVYYNIRSERELMETLPCRLDWLWFLGFDLNSEIPNHSVLSKARRRFGVELFRRFFEGIVYQCVEVGLVDGKKLFCDSTLVRADASKNSVVNTRSLEKHLNRAYRTLLQRLDAEGDEDDDAPDDPGGGGGQGEVNKGHVSTTDPDASFVKKGRGKSGLFYQSHRGLDGAYGVITQTVVGRGDENEAHRLMDLANGHHANTGISPEVVVADSKYGTKANFFACHERGLDAHIPPLRETQKGIAGRTGIFCESDFIYDSLNDTYTCPAGEFLTRRKYDRANESFLYGASLKVCRPCSKRSLCTRRKTGVRYIRRHERQDILDTYYRDAQSKGAKRDIRIRQHFMERSFAEGARYGLKRARWRRMFRVQIQDYLIAVVQNVRLLITHGQLKPAGVMRESVRQGSQFIARFLLTHFGKHKVSHAIAF
jgi:transposase